MAYTDPITRSTYHLVINQTIEISHLDHHLFGPMQCRLNVVILNDTPKFMPNDPTPQTHTIVINIEDSDAENENIILPLSLKGVTSYIHVCNPTKE